MTNVKVNGPPIGDFNWADSVYPNGTFTRTTWEEILNGRRFDEPGMEVTLATPRQREGA